MAKSRAQQEKFSDLLQVSRDRLNLAIKNNEPTAGITKLSGGGGEVHTLDLPGLAVIRFSRDGSTLVECDFGDGCAASKYAVDLIFDQDPVVTETFGFSERPHIRTLPSQHHGVVASVLSQHIKET